MSFVSQLHVTEVILHLKWKKAIRKLYALEVKTLNMYIYEIGPQKDQKALALVA